MPHEDITYFARTNGRLPHRRFGIRNQDRFGHVYIVGKTGTGKSTLIETMVRQDIARGEGFALIDPHGDLVERVASAVPKEHFSRVIYFNATDPAQPFGYNPLRHVRKDRRTLAASGMLELFKKMWPDAWGVRMEHILRNTLLALLDYRDATFADILHMYADRTFRREVIAHVTNEQVLHFWRNEFEKFSFRYRADAIAPVQNKVGAFLADPLLRRILVNPEQDLSIRQIMDEGKVLLVNLSRGRMGADSSSLLGGLLVTTIGLAAFSRAEVDAAGRRPFWLYVDEFQNFTTLAVATMLAELRKYAVGMVLAHQYQDQLEEDVRHAVIGNAGTLISFRLGGKDAGYIAREFSPTFEADDLIRLPNRTIYLRLMIDGAPSKPFSAETLPAVVTP